MQSYEEAGGYGVGDYYSTMQSGGGYGDASGGYGGASGGYGDASGGYGAAESYAPKRGGGFRGGARGGTMRGAGGMRGGGFSTFSPRGGSRGGARGGGMSRGGGAMRGGGPMRGRGAGQRFNPMGGAGFGGAAAPAGHVVFAYNIGPQTAESDVTELFSLYGTVAKVDVIWDLEKNMNKGYAFVTMPDYAEATNAIQQLNGYNYAGKPLQVSFKSAKQ